MRAINHALTGSIIGLLIDKPLIAIPAAFVSHFICDAIPHYDGVPAKPTLAEKQKWQRSKLFKNLLYSDAVLCFVLVLILALTRPHDWWLAAICAFAAASPDFLWIPRYLARNKKPKALTGFDKFASDIQWFQRPIGSVVELAWFICAVIITVPLLK